jgi:hypothetical protein
MANQLIRFLEGIAKDVMVKIQDHYVSADFMVLDIGKMKKIHPLSWEDRSSTLPIQLSTSDLDKSTFNFLEERYAVISIVILHMNSQRRAALRGDVDHPNVKGNNLQGTDGRKMKNLKGL